MERSLKELLIILRDNIHRLNRKLPGLCDLIRRLTNENIFSMEECLRIRNFLKTHRPANAFKRAITHKGNIEGGYFQELFWWRPGAKEPRIKWLNKQIEILDNLLKSN